MEAILLRNLWRFFLGSKWVVFVGTVLEMIPAWFRFEHYSPWPNFSFPGFVNARNSPHKNTEHQQRKPSYQERYYRSPTPPQRNIKNVNRSPTPPQPKTHSSKETSLAKMAYYSPMPKTAYQSTTTCAKPVDLL